MPLAVLRWAGLTVLLLVLTGCLDNQDIRQNRDINVEIRVRGASPPERLAAGSSGLTLVLSDVAAEILGTSTETPVPLRETGGQGYASINFDLFGVDMRAGEWCDIGAVSIRDDLTGEVYEFVKADECLPMFNIKIEGIWTERELGFRRPSVLQRSSAA